MSWVTVIWSAGAGACLTLGLIYLLVWSLNHRALASLCFSVMVFSVLGLAIMEMITMWTESPVVFGRTIQWTHLVYAIGVTGSLGFVHFYFGTGRNRLLALAVGLRLLAVVANFTTGLNLHIAAIHSLTKATFLGEQVSILGEWVPNPWMRLGWLASVVQLWYVVDASIRLWRTGAAESRKRAVIIGGALVIFIVLAVVNAAVVTTGVLRMPLLTSIPFLGMLLVMGYELSRDVLRAATLSDDLAQQRNEVAHLSRVTTLGEISGSLAHELGQPLGAILTNTDSIEMLLQSPAPDLAEVRVILADIRRDDLRASEIIHGMRAFLRRQQLDLQPLDVRYLAEETVKLISSDATARRTTVGIEIPPDLPLVRGDRVHLQQVLLNLLVNGMDAMSTCPVADRRVTIRAALPAPHTVEFAVSDAGVGIPPGDIDRIFTPFHTTKQGGLGLGLPICRSIIEAHGGSISLQNNPERGTTARFTLPACQEGLP